MIPLPCPETVYLGPDRKPGTFLERLNTQEFTHLLDVMAEEVQEIIRTAGPSILYYRGQLVTYLWGDKHILWK